MRPLAWVAGVVAAMALSGCFRTTYRNLDPLASSAAGSRGVIVGESWRNFYVDGIAPGRVDVDAAAQCGRARHVSTIHTERSFMQALVSLLSSNDYGNVYSPWTGEVTCDDGAPNGPGAPDRPHHY